MAALANEGRRHGSLAERLGKVLVVGGGNMGSAICAGLVGAAGVEPGAVCVANPGQAKREVLEARFGVRTVASARDGLPADTIVVAVKPAKVGDVARQLADAGIGGALVISIAAGVSTAYLNSVLGDDVPVVRVMPNTPLLSGAGMSGVSAGASAGEGSAQLVRELFDVLGGAVVVPEDEQDIVTALSGSAPAYFELVCESMARAGEELGMDYATARRLAVDTMYGTAVMLRQTGQDLREAIEVVSSPGGTTVAALDAFARCGLEDAVAAGVRAAARRSAELGE